MDALTVAESFLIEMLIFAAAFFVLEKCRRAEAVGFVTPRFWEEWGFAALNKLIVVPLAALASSQAGILAMDYGFPYEVLYPYLYKTPFALQFFLLLLLMDFSTYWRHRLMHRFGWPFHAVHHSAQGLSWITALRLHPVEMCIGIFIDSSFMYVFGFESQAIGPAVLASVFYNYFLHANIDLKYPRPLRYILASPHFHRWHHATDKSAYDKNFCGMLSLYDVLFGTYHHPDDGLPRAYGLSPKEQAAYPARFLAQVAYPFKRIFKRG